MNERRSILVKAHLGMGQNLCKREKRTSYQLLTIRGIKLINLHFQIVTVQFSILHFFVSFVNCDLYRVLASVIDCSMLVHFL